MQKIPLLLRCLWLALCVPLLAYPSPQQTGQSDCKPLISHSGFAELVIPSEGGTQKLPIKVSPSQNWRIRNSDYVDWIEILDGDSGTGPGTITVKLAANTEKSCRVGILTIVGVQMFYGSPMRIGSPIRILQRGTEAAAAKKEPKPSLPAVVTLPSFAGSDPQPPAKPGAKVYVKSK